MSVVAGEDWDEAILFDKPRHQTNMKMRLDWPRINQFPEWYTDEAEETYTVRIPGGEKKEYTGRQLIDGMEVKVKAGDEARFVVTN